MTFTKEELASRKKWYKKVKDASYLKTNDLRVERLQFLLQEDINVKYTNFGVINMDNMIIEGVDFSHCYFFLCSFRGTIFKNCKFKRGVLNEIHANEGTKFIGCDMRYTEWIDSWRLKYPSIFTNCRFKGSFWSHDIRTDFNENQFKDCTGYKKLLI